MTRICPLQKNIANRLAFPNYMLFLPASVAMNRSKNKTGFLLRLPLVLLLILIFTFGFSIYRIFLPDSSVYAEVHNSHNKSSVKKISVHHDLKSFPSLRQLVLDIQKVKKKGSLQHQTQNISRSNYLLSGIISPADTDYYNVNNPCQLNKEHPRTILSRNCFFLI
jgi:hypothetical protein